MRRIQLEQAVSAYLRWLRGKRGSSTLKQARACFSVAVKCAGVIYLDELLLYHLSQPLVSLSEEKRRASIYILNRWIRWCRDTYDILIPQLAPPPSRAAAKRKSNQVATATKVLELDKRITVLLSRLKLPAQQVTFLLGYLYGWPLCKIQQVPWEEITAQPQHPDLVEALARLHSQSPAVSRPLAAWLGNSLSVTYRTWKRWSGGVPFTDVCKAGVLWKARRGIRYESGVLWDRKLTLALPALSEENVGRMPGLKEL